MSTRALVHVCCGPCFIHPLQQLRDAGYDPHAYFYNPNIFPSQEYDRRCDGARQYAADQVCEFVAEDYQPDQYETARGVEATAPRRCVKCWELRLRRTARYAAEHGFSVFTSTLLVSPYQDINVINSLGEQAAQEAGVTFYPQDFRSGFRAAQKTARELNMYRQNYCGCRFSWEERNQRVGQT